MTLKINKTVEEAKKARRSKIWDELVALGNRKFCFEDRICTTIAAWTTPINSRTIRLSPLDRKKLIEKRENEVNIVLTGKSTFDEKVDAIELYIESLPQEKPVERFNPFSNPVSDIFPLNPMIELWSKPIDRLKPDK